jgi:cyclopropane fatty-acyl-phospholipid synthase-like methyltransferase
LQPGETVLDLGSGGGIDVLLSARRDLCFFFHGL